MDLMMTRDSRAHIGFVVACAICGAISTKELNLWAESIIKANPMEAIPDYMFDLVDFNGSLLGIFNLIGFVPSDRWVPEGNLEIYGITALRGRLSASVGVDACKALEALNQRPDVLERFKQAFPFFDLPSEVLKSCTRPFP